MAKTTKKKVLKTTAPLKETIKETVKSVEVTKTEPVKKVEVKEAVKAEVKKEPEKISAKPEPKKIAAKKEPKKITTAKAPEKIATKPEPKKLEAKPAAVKETAKPAVKEEKKPAKKAEPKKAEPKKAEPKKDATKKVAAKKEVKPVVSKAEEKKPATKKETAKKAKPKAVKKEASKQPAKKAEPKKVAKKAVNKEKIDYYENLPLEECIRLMQVMNVHYNYDDYYRLLLDEADLTVLEKNIVEGNNLKELKLSFSEQGYDEDLVLVTLNKVANTMDIKAAEYKDLKKAMKHAIKFQSSMDGEVNAAEYLNEFALSEKLLMIGQRKNIVSAKEVSDLIDADVEAYFAHFFDFAYALLPEWQYNDVKYYEDFAYAVLSQYADLFEAYQLRIQLDVADLYIKHGDYQHGDELYGYILRDNQIKDYIYYRYASIYKDIDFNKAKSIAYSSLQFVDDRYTYYPNIMEIINE